MFKTKRNPDYDTENVGILDHDNHDDPGSKFWSIYNHIMKSEDIYLTETWDKEMDFLLVYAGLFSAVVAGFLIEGYKALIPDSSDDVPILLAQIAVGLSNLSNGSQFTYSPPPPFQRSIAVSLYNGLWFFSLVLSLVCALGATLIKQLGRNYLEQIRSVPKTSGRAFKRERFFQGIEESHIKVWIDLTVLKLHLAVLSFFMGLVVFVWPIHRGIAYSLLTFIALMFTLYFLLTIIPPIRGNLPNITPFTSLILIRVAHLMAAFSVWIKKCGKLPKRFISIIRLLPARFCEAHICTQRAYSRYPQGSGFS